MRLHFLVEGPSEEAFLRQWLPRFIGAHTFNIIVHQGKGKLPDDFKAKPDKWKRGLLDLLPATLRAYGKSLNSDTDRVVVLVDLDDQDCKQLLKRFNRLQKSLNPSPEVVFRIAIEETEAFLLGDSRAIKQAYPKAKISLLKHHKYDSICGTWELLQTVIREADYEDKVEWAERIGEHLGVIWNGKKSNKSPSFCSFCKGIVALCGDMPD